MSATASPGLNFCGQEMHQHLHHLQEHAWRNQYSIKNKLNEQEISNAQAAFSVALNFPGNLPETI